MNKYQVFITFVNDDKRDRSYIIYSNLNEQEFSNRLQQGIMKDDIQDRNFIININNILSIEWYTLEIDCNISNNFKF